MKKSKFKINKKGFSIIELVVVLGLLAVVVSVLVQLNLMFSKGVSSSSLNVRANAVAAETMEALRFLREVNWNNIKNLDPDTDYYLSFSEETSEKWDIENSDPGAVDGIFTRSFLVREVYRDAVTGSIVSSGGELDEETFLVEATISWNDRGSDKNIKLTTYLADY